MIKDYNQLFDKEKDSDLEEFANYLGVDFEDYKEFVLCRNTTIDFDDYSR
jgi:hypothetical protein